MKRPIRESELAWETWLPGTKQEIRGKSLCDVGGRARVGVGLVELPPGSDTRPAHYHSLEEEHLYVLSGTAILRLRAEELELRQGDYVCFPAGQEIFHHLENRCDEPCRYLMIGERNPADRVVHEESR